MTDTQLNTELEVLAFQPCGLDVSLSYDGLAIYTPPAWMAQRYQQAIAAWQSRLDYDSLRARPCQFSVEQGSVRVGGGPLRYSETRSLQECVRAFRQGEFEGAALEEGANITSAGLLVAVLSQEGHLLLPRRSGKVATMGGLWSAGLGEGLEPVDFDSGTLDNAVRRTLQEELAIDPDTILGDTLKVLGVMRNLRSLSITFYAVVDLTGRGVCFEASRLLQQAVTAQDAWEHDEFLVIEPRVSELARVLSDTGVACCPGTGACLVMLEAYTQHSLTAST